MTDQHLPAPGTQIPVIWREQTSVETVNRLTATQVVTDSGRKFRLDTGKEIGGVTSNLHGSPRAVLPAEARYARTLAEARVQHAAAAASQACTEWDRRHRRDPEYIRAAIDALTALSERITEANQS